MPRTHDSLIVELTQDCNHDCLHCYNCWKNAAPYPRGQLPTAETVAMIGKAVEESGARHVTLTGGEPFLRDDLDAIVAGIHTLGATVNVISNGRLVDAAAVARFAGRIAVWELPLLSADRAIHDRMSGAPGAFDRVTMAIAELKAARERVVGVFVATTLNLATWRRTMDLGFALGVDAMMFNRFNPGGRGARNIELLQAPPDRLQEALDVAEELAVRYELPVTCSIAMPPCLVDTARYAHLSFGFCAAAGTDRAYYTIDPVGNVRPCNHSMTILGNIRSTGFWQIVDGPAMRAFAAARPVFCAGCRLERTCLGGCKAAAEVCCGSVSAQDPFVAAFSDRAVKVR